MSQRLKTAVKEHVLRKRGGCEGEEEGGCEGEKRGGCEGEEEGRL